MTPLLTTGALAWMRSHHGTITAQTLAQFGVSRRHRLAAVETGLLIVEYPGVYRIATQPITLESCAVALSALHPRAFLTGPTGGRLLGLRRMPASSSVYICAPHGLGRTAGSDVILRQSRRVDPTDVQVRADGVRVASPWRLAFDLAADLSAHDHASVVEQILERKLCQVSTLVATGRRLAHNARPGSLRFLETLAARIPGGALESDPEVCVARALMSRGVPVHSQAIRLALPNGRFARIDISVPAVRWGVEVDVHPDHLLLEGTTNDKQRDRQSRMIGWQIERVTGLDLLDVDALADELVILYNLRRAEILRLDRVPLDDSERAGA